MTFAKGVAESDFVIQDKANGGRIRDIIKVPAQYSWTIFWFRSVALDCLHHYLRLLSPPFDHFRLIGEMRIDDKQTSSFHDKFRQQNAPWRIIRHLRQGLDRPADDRLRADDRETVFPHVMLQAAHLGNKLGLITARYRIAIHFLQADNLGAQLFQPRCERVIPRLKRLADIPKV
ncbi:MAG TPA: hypothetical protein VKH62_10160 [Candidatus Binatia bacterium]|nr:hypothetical protein [Candidatus Binatia bacterium]